MWEKGYDRFLSLGSWTNAIIYGVPGAIILGAMYFFEVPDRLWTPVLLVYAVAAVADQLNYGFMALNIQTKVNAHYLADQLKKG